MPISGPKVHEASITEQWPCKMEAEMMFLGQSWFPVKTADGKKHGGYGETW